MNTIIIIANRLIKIFANFIKALSYPFHWIFPQKRWTIPSYDPAKIKKDDNYKIQKTIWQTNYSAKSTLPVYANFLFNRWLSKDWDYRYVSTEEREEYIKQYATKEQVEAFLQLNDGAAQADFWRLFVLYNEGGVYMDIDAHLVWPLSKIVSPDDDEVFIRAKKGHINNYFIAAKKGNIHIKKTLEIVVKNIQEKKIGQGGVYDLTGPTALNKALKGQKYHDRFYRITCLQGNFTNEHFQYMDKPRGKWTYQDKNNILKNNK